MTRNIRAMPIYLWALLGAILVVNILGFAFNLWSQYPLLDDLMHLVSLFTLTLCLAYYLSARVLVLPQEHTVLWCLVLVGVGLGIGAVWEIMEWLVRQLVNVQEKKVVDTIVDLFLDLVGAGLAVFYGKSRIK